MPRNARRWATTLALALAGCAADEAADAPATRPAGELVTEPVPDAEPAGAARDVYGLVIYDVAVPAGTLSVNTDLWKRIDEQAVDVASYDLLYKNGLRVGVGPGREFEHVRSYIDDPDARQVSVNDLQGRTTYLVMKEVGGQIVTYFDDENNLVGDQFGPSENRLHVGFRRTPRSDDSLRVSLTPAVAHRFRDLRLGDLGGGGGGGGGMVEEEQMYHDVNLRVDVPVGGFLLVAPSDDSDLESSLGHALLREERGPDLVERALIVVPQKRTLREIGG